MNAHSRPAGTPDWEALRGDFPATASVTYLDIARKALSPVVAAEAAASWFADIASSAAGARSFSMDEVEKTRIAVARTFGADPERIALVKNTSEVVNIVAHGLDWREGDNVVISGAEHENNTFPWRPLSARGIETRIVPERPDGTVSEDDLIAAMDARTRVLSVAWVTYGIGQRMDLDLLAEACRERGVLMLVDAIQALGVLDRRLDALGAHVVGAGGHKAQLSVAGAGLMYITPEVLDQVRPVYMSKFSFDTLDRTVADPAPAPGARRFEYGNPNFLGTAIQREAAAYIGAIGLAAIEARIRHLTTLLIEEVQGIGLTVRTPLDWGRRAGIVSIDLGGPSSDAVEAALAADGVRVASKDGHLRAAAHFYNNEDDVRRFADRLRVHLKGS
ncbi:aminotransferase class V-fold PLP-dependent enzyme [Rhodobium gokarnense]|uniref:Selenocysteine lyase/cysteine desulfurase n=1 Tax=Rhodobium gokarnense TaxID=364296 RepID=A0ABT3HDU0_9HYPH|nr:aminotransferase class V-fold PLP-dependent enzyme [Rhodobium gokarnense]MCW2308504.1 selenocysteine lyase/cysteine desulfurase [Rhodobium gokarnense]